MGPLRTFSYSVPSALNVRVGSSVRVPFGRQRLQGVVFSLPEAPAVPETREDVLATHAGVIAGAVNAVREGNADPDAEIEWLHPFLGDLNWREWFLTLRVHSLDHARQLAALQEPA